MILSLNCSQPTDWYPVPGDIMTRWAKTVKPNKVLPDYPRPQLVRKQWKNLNGLWEYAIRPQAESQPDSFDGKILVPFPIESALSGVKKPVGEEQKLWYRHSFEVPKKWKNQRVMLNFGAVDWETTLWINGSEVGNHRGGYDAFSFDITDFLNPTGKQEIVLSVWDPIDSGYQPRGKQVKDLNIISTRTPNLYGQDGYPFKFDPRYRPLLNPPALGHDKFDQILEWAKQQVGE